jgi:hypothetical protein
MRKYVSGFALIGALIVAALVFGPFGLGLDQDCRNRVIHEYPSPDGKRTAILFRRDCGAMADDSQQISILTPGAKPTGGGNAFVSDDNHGAARKAQDGTYVALRWLSSHDLLIGYEAGARAFKKVAKLDGVDIVYLSGPDDRLAKPL